MGATVFTAVMLGPFLPWWPPCSLAAPQAGVASLTRPCFLPVDGTGSGLGGREHRCGDLLLAELIFTEHHC